MVAAAAWPSGTSVRIATSPRGVGPGLSSFATPFQARSHARTVLRSIALAQAELAADRSAAGLVVEESAVSLVEEEESGRAT
jgi:hypothetical protein